VVATGDSDATILEIQQAYGASSLFNEQYWLWLQLEIQMPQFLGDNFCCQVNELSFRIKQEI
jgi:hypothetical protein